MHCAAAEDEKGGITQRSQPGYFQGRISRNSFGGNCRRGTTLPLANGEAELLRNKIFQPI